MVAGRIGDETIREVRERASLMDVISEAVALKRRGRTALGLCPFHAEKTPSFNVSEDRGFYHCFGCGEHGDVFTFVMKTQGLAFPEAVRSVAARAGVVIPDEPGGGPRKPTEPLIAMNAAAAAFFQGTLRSARGQRARTYLEERGIVDATIERFRLGYAPAEGDALARHLRAQGMRIEDAVELGLVGRRQGGGFYDRFRERVIFPINDTSGRVVAFGGRILPGVTGDAPKYLNSPESSLFHKGRMVYGLDLARTAIRTRGRVLIVEGYMDVIGLAQVGVEDAVAPNGTALTVDQLRLLRRFTDRIIACFDGDDAGRRAAARSFPLFLEAGLWGLGVFLPAGEDPDTFVRTHGGERFEAEVERAVPLVDAYVRDLAGPAQTSVGRHADAAREVVRLLQKVEDPFAREPLVRLAAHYLGMRPETLLAEGAVRRARVAAPVPAVQLADAPSAEELLVELMATDAGVATQVRDARVIEAFESPDWQRIAEVLAQTTDQEDRNQIVQQLPRALRDRVVHRLLADGEDEGDRERVLVDCIAAIRRRRERRARTELRDALRAAEQRGDAAAIAAAQEAFQRALADKDRT